jgi:hypothetical protein
MEKRKQLESETKEISIKKCGDKFDIGSVGKKVLNDVCSLTCVLLMFF